MPLLYRVNNLLPRHEVTDRSAVCMMQIFVILSDNRMMSVVNSKRHQRLIIRNSPPMITHGAVRHGEDFEIPIDVLLEQLRPTLK